MLLLPVVPLLCLHRMGLSLFHRQMQLHLCIITLESCSLPMQASVKPYGHKVLCPMACNAACCNECPALHMQASGTLHVMQVLWFRMQGHLRAGKGCTVPLKLLRAQVKLLAKLCHLAALPLQGCTALWRLEGLAAGLGRLPDPCQAARPSTDGPLCPATAFGHSYSPRMPAC